MTAASDERACGDEARYTLPAYILDKWPSVVLGGLAVASVVWIMSMLGVSSDAVVLVAVIVACAFALSGLVSFARRRRYYREALVLSRSIDSAFSYVSLSEEATFLEGRLMDESIARLSSLASAELASERDLSASYRRYIELWIHEVKTPIAAAKLISERLHGPDALALRHEIERIESQVEQALYYARSTSLTNDYAIRQTNLAEVVRDACRKNMCFLVERGVSVDVRIEEGYRVFADASWLSFVISQTVVNAAKYGAGKITFSAEEVDAGTSRAHTQLCIEDDGCGIPAADMPRVFDRGFTGDNGRAHGSSTGMGLYLCAVLCERMGIGIVLASEEGTGTRVMLAFPHDRRVMGRVAESAAVKPSAPDWDLQACSSASEPSMTKA